MKQEIEFEGFSFREKLEKGISVATFRDLALLPRWSEVEPEAVDVSSRVSRNVSVSIPFLSSPMESVTGPSLAISMAKNGAIGILHRNCSVDEQTKMAREIKNARLESYESSLGQRDEEGRLLIGAAVGPHDMKRAEKLDSFVDLIIIDVAHFHTKNCFSGVREIRKNFAGDIIVGNIGTYEAAEDIISRLGFIDGLRCGIGSGSTCTTSVQTRISAPTLFAVASAADACRSLGADIPIIADGGVRNPGDAALAIAAGASAVMLGSVLAATEESPASVVTLNGRKYKRHYGMGSKRARRKRYSLDRYSKPAKSIPEGSEGLLPLSGSVSKKLNEFVGALKASCGYLGAGSIDAMWDRAKFCKVSSAGGFELTPHTIARINE